MSVILSEHQINVLDKIKNGNILLGGVGSGKTRTSLAYFYTKIAKGELCINGKGTTSKFTNPIDLYIITTAKNRDDLVWEKELVPFALNKDVNLSLNPITIVVDSWHNIKKYSEIKNAFFIFDEQRVVGTGVWVRAFKKIAKFNKWILLSATPGDNFLDYLPIFIANGFFKNVTEFREKHVIYKPYMPYPVIERFVYERELDNLRNKIQIILPDNRKTKRHLLYNYIQYDKQAYLDLVQRRFNYEENRPITNVSELCFLLRKSIHSNDDRKHTIIRLYNKYNKCIIFYNYNYELYFLRELLEENGIPFSEYNGKKHEAIPIGKQWIYLVNYKSGAEGWNCITTNTIIFNSLNHSYKIMEQAMGRIDRMNTKYIDLYYEHIVTQTNIDKRIMKCIEEKKIFNERNFERSLV